MLHPFAHGKFNLISRDFGKSITGPSPPERHAFFLSKLNTNCNIKIANRPRLSNAIRCAAAIDYFNRPAHRCFDKFELCGDLAQAYF